MYKKELFITKSCSTFLNHIRTNKTRKHGIKFTPYPLLGMDMGTKFIGISITQQEKIQQCNDLRYLTQTILQQQKRHEPLQSRIIAKPLTTLIIEQQQDMYKQVRETLEMVCNRFGVKGIVSGYQDNYQSAEELLNVLKNVFEPSVSLSTLPILLQNETRSSFESYIHMVDKKTNGNHNMDVMQAFRIYKKDIEGMKSQEKKELNALSAAIILDRAIKKIDALNKSVL